MRKVNIKYNDLYRVTIIELVKGLVSFAAGFIMAKFSSTLLNYAMDGETSALLDYSLRFIIFVLVYELFNFGMDMYGGRLKGIRSHRFKLQIYDKFYNLSIDEVEGINGGQVKEVLGDDMATIESFFTSNMPRVINGAIVSIGYLAYISNKSLLCGVVILIMGLSQFIEPILSKKYFVQHYDETRVIEEEITDYVVSCYNGLATLKSYNLINWFNKRLVALHKEYLRIGIKGEIVSSGAASLEKTIESVLKFGTYGFVGMCVLFNVINMDSALEIIVLSGTLYVALNNIFEGYGSFFIFKKAKERMSKIIRDKDESVENNKGHITPIKLRNISFSYGEDELLKDINLIINGGNKIAIIGENGGGKSTLFKIIMGIYKPLVGEIFYGHNNLNSKESININEMRNTPIEEVQNKMSWLPQEDFMFLKSPREFFEILSEERIIDYDKALNMAYALGLKDDVLDNERIGNLSGGERKKVYLSVALTKESEVIFLDEPTNSLDIQCRGILVDIIKESKKTIVTISHDKEIIMNCDEIIQVRNNNAYLLSNNHKNIDYILDYMESNDIVTSGTEG